MKKLYLGNQAVARGFYEAGVTFVSAYPGTPSTEIPEFAAGYPEIRAEWAPNEKCAYEAAIGASMAGARSACAMKHVGLNVAADPLFTSSYTGVGAGMVAVVADDAGMHSSQNEQDSRHYARAAKIPMLEPSDSEECRDFAVLAFDISEQFDTPVLLRTCTRVAHSQYPIEERERREREIKPYSKDPAKYVMNPANAVKRHAAVEKRLEELRKYSEASPLNREEDGDRSIGIVTAGTCYEYVKEALPEAGVFKVGMSFPLPVERIRSFAEKYGRVIVVEELDGYMEQELRAEGVKIDGGKDLFGPLGESSQRTVAQKILGKAPEHFPAPEGVPARPPVMCAGCPHRGLFHVLSRLKVTVCGDIGCYTLGASAPLNAIDSVLCMGASVTMLHGFLKARKEESGKAVAVIGDSTFVHSGITGLINAVYNGSSSTVIVADNSITGMTGHQQNPTTGLTLKNEPAYALKIEDIARAAGVRRVRVIDPYDLEETEKAIREELAADEVSVIISRRPCVMLKYVKKNAPISVDPDRCRGCRSCMSIGCPAISFKGGKAVIDGTLCIGCGLCTQKCRFGAMEERV